MAEIEIEKSCGSHQKKMNKGRHKLSAGKCRSMILVSRNIRYIRDIREGSLGRGVKRLGCRRVQFSSFATCYMYENYRQKIQYIQPFDSFSVVPNA